jgi:hypothetical protein
MLHTGQHIGRYGVCHTETKRVKKRCKLNVRGFEKGKKERKKQKRKPCLRVFNLRHGLGWEDGNIETP